MIRDEGKLTLQSESSQLNRHLIITFQTAFQQVGFTL